MRMEWEARGSGQEGSLLLRWQPLLMVVEGAALGLVVVLIYDSRFAVTGKRV
jgi:hypothetical protein